MGESREINCVLGGSFGNGICGIVNGNAFPLAGTSDGVSMDMGG